MTITEEIEYLEHLFSGHTISKFEAIEDGLRRSGVEIEYIWSEDGVTTFNVYVRPKILKKWKEKDEEV